MKTKQSVTVRRSVALPKELIDEVQTVAPVELRDNLNRLVIVALQDFAAKQKAHAFEKAMAQMAADMNPFCISSAAIPRHLRLQLLQYQPIQVPRGTITGSTKAPPENR